MARALWAGSLSFGLVSIPVVLRGTRPPVDGGSALRFGPSAGLTDPASRSAPGA